MAQTTEVMRNLTPGRGVFRLHHGLVMAQAPVVVSSIAIIMSFICRTRT